MMFKPTKEQVCAALEAASWPNNSENRQAIRKALVASHEVGLKSLPKWEVFTLSLAQNLQGKYWLAIVGQTERLIGEYEWQQGWSPDGFNTGSHGRIDAKNVSHVLKFVPNEPPELPEAFDLADTILRIAAST